MIVMWATSPNAHGSAVTAYRIKLKASGASYQTTTYCDGTATSVVSTLSCTIPMSVLTTAPFSMALGSTVVAEVEALNSAGYSTPSSPNSAGALVESLPTIAPTLTKGSGSTDT